MSRLKHTSGFWLLLGVLLLAVSTRVFLWFACAVLVHELGHALAVYLLGGKVSRVELTGIGPVLRLENKRILTYREECIIALAGPLANFFLALLASAWADRFGGGDAYLLAGLSLSLAVFNLIPAGPLDGGRIMQSVLSHALGPDLGERCCRAGTAGLGGAMAALGLFVLLKGGNITLLLCAAWLLAGQKRWN